MLPLTLTGVVVHGKAIGRTIGYPTANLEPFSLPADLPDGVYASRVMVGSLLYPGVTNIGPRPTVDASPKRTIETYLIGFTGDLYGATISVTLTHFLRGTQKFASLDELKARLGEDSARAEELFSSPA